MGESKHTPGPWRRDGSMGGWSVASNKLTATIIAPIWADEGDPVAFAVYTPCGFVAGHLDANARLIAAAPELYEALLAVRHIVERDAQAALAAVGDGEDAAGKADAAVSYLDQLDAALKKAEG